MQDFNDIGENLRRFDYTLGEVIRGNRKGVVQLRDIAYFKRIRSKIDSYPILNEMFHLQSAKARYRISTPKSKHSNTLSASFVKRRGESAPKIEKIEKIENKTTDTVFYIRTSLKNAIMKTKSIVEMYRKLTIATLNTSVTKNIPLVVIKSVFFILLGSTETSLIFKNKTSGEDCYFEIDGNSTNLLRKVNEE